MSSDEGVGSLPLTLEERVQQIRDRAALSGITVTKLSGEVSLAYEEPPDTIRLHHGDPAYRITDELLACRFEHEVRLLDEDEDEVAKVETQHVVEFQLSEPLSPVDEEALSVWTDENVYFMVYPYVRESIQTMTARLNLDPVILGVLPRGQARPTGVVVMSRTVQSYEAGEDRTAASAASEDSDRSSGERSEPS